MSCFWFVMWWKMFPKRNQEIKQPFKLGTCEEMRWWNSVRLLVCLNSLGLSPWPMQRRTNHLNYDSDWMETRIRRHGGRMPCCGAAFVQKSENDLKAKANCSWKFFLRRGVCALSAMAPSWQRSRCSGARRFGSSAFEGLWHTAGERKESTCVL